MKTDNSVPVPAGERAVVERLLTLARLHLGTEVAWVSLLSQGQHLILATSGHAAAMGVATGTDLPLDGSYCVRVLAGNLPAVIPDSRRNLVTRELETTRTLGIGSYAGVPWRTPDGDLSGMVCCVSRHPDPGLAVRSLDYLRVIAELVGDVLGGPGQQAHRADAHLGHEMRTIFDSEAVQMVFQPAVRLSDGTVAAVEALARFDHVRFPTPDLAFAAASRFDLGADLEHLAVRRAFTHLPDLPAGVMMCVNLSAEALLDARVQQTLLASSGRRIGLEVTEHVQVSDYRALVSVTERMRAAGFRIVVDDAGAGYASLRHILQLQPDVIKLDIGLVRDVDRDPVRQALARSLVTFAGDIGAGLVAEGIETHAELDTLRRLGVGYGQGYLLARPNRLERVLRDSTFRPPSDDASMSPVDDTDRLTQLR